LIGFDQGINSYAVYTDHLNTPRLVTKIDNPQNPKALTDTSNDLPQVSYGEPEGISPLAIPVWQWSYSPFGADLANGYEARPTTIANNFKPELWTWTGLPETGGADPYQVAQETWRIQANLTTPPSLNIRYPGQYYDFEAGLVQNWWRTYEPRMAGRYTSADPIGLDGGFNRFGYAYQDGVNRYDKNGLCPLCAFALAYLPEITIFGTEAAIAAGYYFGGVPNPEAALVSGFSNIGRLAKAANTVEAAGVCTAKGISNPIPGTLARVIPDGIPAASLGRPGATDVFVTAAEDIRGLNAAQIAGRLTIQPSPTGFKVIEFPTPQSGIASPIFRSDPGFIGGGRTLGGAREFVIPNQPTPLDSLIWTVQ
jgi:RHS repeat-associated protein